MRKLLTFLVAVALVAGFMPSTVLAVSKNSPEEKWDSDMNGFPDAGVYVQGKYTSLYAYDYNGDYYWDLGDGRIYKTVDSVEDLDTETLTVCDYVNVYRADFNNDAFMDHGWIQNHIVCTGMDQGAWNYLIVSNTDPRYTGNPENAVWGTWEYKVLTESHSGNLANPHHHMN